MILFFFVFVVVVVVHQQGPNIDISARTANTHNCNIRLTN